MEKFAVNYNNLQGDLSPKSQTFTYEDVKDRLRKVAFDVVRFVEGDDISGLWQIQETDEGEVIVAKYDDTSNFQVEKTASVHTNWGAFFDKSGENIHIFYKDSPVTKISLASVGIPVEDAPIVCEYLPNKLATNEMLMSNLLAEIPKTTLTELRKLHPELNNKK